MKAAPVLLLFVFSAPYRVSGASELLEGMGGSGVRRRERDLLSQRAHARTQTDTRVPERNSEKALPVRRHAKDVEETRNPGEGREGVEERVQATEREEHSEDDNGVHRRGSGHEKLQGGSTLEELPSTAKMRSAARARGRRWSEGRGRAGGGGPGIAKWRRARRCTRSSQGASNAHPIECRNTRKENLCACV